MKDCRRRVQHRRRSKKTSGAANTGRAKVDHRNVAPVAATITLAPSKFMARSSRGLGHGPLKAGTRVRLPYALPTAQLSGAVRLTVLDANSLAKNYQKYYDPSR